MRITVFGATGRTGRYILAEGVRRDHQLTASPAGRQPWSARRHSRTVRKAIDGADAVISTVSAERRKGPNHVAEVSR